MQFFKFVFCSLAIAVFTTVSVAAQDSHSVEGLKNPFPERPYSPYANRSFPTNVYFGDTHVHTAL